VGVWVIMYVPRENKNRTATTHLPLVLEMKLKDEGLVEMFGMADGSAIPVVSVNACGRRVNSLCFRKHLCISQGNTKNNSK